MAIIDKPSDYFDTKLYVGNESTNAITGLDFQPDWVWLKNRDTAYYHGLYDSVRGTGNTKSLYSNAAETEGQNSGNMNLASFNSDGFTLGATSSTNIINKSSQNHVSWNWKAGTSFTNDASSTGIGTIDSTGSVNTDAGFSICSYTGTGSAGTVGHGLGSELACYIIKQRNTTGGWIVYHKGNTSSPQTDYLRLDKTDATVDDAIFNDTAPTSSVFSIGTNAPVNTSSGTYIAYCFAEKQGYSKFGSYTGNGSADGPFVYTGMRPAMVILKNTSSVQDWVIKDNKRDIDNPVDQVLYPNGSYAEGSGATVDFLSNGFKVRTTAANTNGSGNTFIYMAFAENPFVASNFNPATAR